MKKKFFLLILLITVSRSANADFAEDIVDKAKQFKKSEETCTTIIDNHAILLADSENYIKTTFGVKKTDITSYQIANLQKVIKARHAHLKKIRKFFKDYNNCGYPWLGEAIAVHDFNLLAENFQNTQIRRMVYSFTKAEDYDMLSFKENYTYYTNIKTITQVRNNLTASEQALVEQFGLNIEQKTSGIRISTEGDALKRIWGWVVGKGLIRTWGYISDVVKVRRGYLRKQTDAQAVIRAYLKPLDLLFEKRKFVLSNLTIPGHWGHVAIWLGTKEELIAMGIWDKPFFETFKEQIELGKNIVQMRKEGMVFSSLQEFMNLDEIAVTRVIAAQTDEEKIYKMLNRNVLKSYDFAFDATSLGKVTCTELVSFSYGDIQWPTGVAMGRTIIRPDDLARLTLAEDRQAELILYVYGEGDKVIYKSEEDWKRLFSQP